MSITASSTLLANVLNMFQKEESSCTNIANRSNAPVAKTGIICPTEDSRKKKKMLVIYTVCYNAGGIF